MSIERIPFQNWRNYIDRFNRIHNKWLFTLEEIEADGSKKNFYNNLKLKEAALDMEEGENNNRFFIIGERKGEELNHFVEKVKNISVQKSDEGAEEVLFIESESGTTAEIKFRSSVKPENLDGIT